MTLLLAASDNYYWFLDLELWSLATFAALSAIVLKFGAGPVISALRGRQQGIEDQLKQLDDARREIEQLREEQRIRKKELQAEAQEMVAEAKRDAARTAQEMVARAEQEIEKVKSRSIREVELARRKAVHTLAEHATETSVRMAREHLERELSDADHDRLIRLALSEMSGRDS
ncbi:ATP synthase F0 subunit B [bacterium]|nr:ATP synthase F0 subunit B [bacterium]